MVIRHAGQKPAGERKQAREPDRESCGGGAAEDARNDDRGDNQQQGVQQRIGEQGSAFDGQAEWTAGELVIDPGDGTEPPAIRGGEVDGTAEGGVVVIDVAEAPFAGGEHLLGLGDPVIAVVVALGDDQLATIAFIAGERTGVERDVLACDGGDGFDAGDAGARGPELESEGANEDRDPEERRGPETGLHSRGSAAARRS